MKPTAKAPENIIQMHPDLATSEARGRVSVTVRIPADHHRLMLSRECYATEWHGSIVRELFDRIAIKIRFFRGEYEIAPEPGQTLAGILCPIREAASRWRNLRSRKTAAVTFQVDSATWRDYLECATAAGVPVAALIRAAFANRVSLWHQMDMQKILQAIA